MRTFVHIRSPKRQSNSSNLHLIVCFCLCHLQSVAKLIKAVMPKRNSLVSQLGQNYQIGIKVNKKKKKKKISKLPAKKQVNFTNFVAFFSVIVLAGVMYNTGSLARANTANYLTNNGLKRSQLASIGGPVISTVKQPLCKNLSGTENFKREHFNEISRHLSVGHHMIKQIRQGPMSTTFLQEENCNEERCTK